MTIFTEVRTGQSFLEDIQAPLGDVLGAQAEEAWVRSPVPSIGRMLELRGANQGLPVGVGSDTGDIEMAPPSALVSAEDARTRIKDEGLALTVPDTGISRDALDILVKRKSEEKRRKDIIARGPSGIGPALAGFGVALGVSALDPLNVASAFIPVVSGARYGSMIVQAGGALGRVGVRARVGALEGAVGAAVVEPLVLGAAYQEQADYHLSDTLLNIALGGALGGGLHVGIGAASDALARRAAWQQARATDPLPRILEEVSPETREAALRVGISQAMTGRAVDVEPLIRRDIGSDIDVPRRAAVPLPAADFDLGPLVLSKYADYTAVRPGDLPFLQGLVADLQDTRPGYRTFQDNPYGPGVIVTGVKATTPDWFQAYNKEATANNDLRARIRRQNLVREQQKEVPDHMPTITRAQVTDVIDKLIARVPLGKREGELAKLLVGEARALREARANDIVSARQSRAEEIQASLDAQGARDLADFEEYAASAATRSFDPAEGRMVDMEAVRVGDEKLKSAPANDDAAAIQESLADITQDVQALARALGDDELVARELKPFDDLADSADAYGRAVQAYASCGLRRGF